MRIASDFAHSPQVVVWRCDGHHEPALVVARSAQGLTAETVVVALEGTETIKLRGGYHRGLRHSKPVAECELVLWLASLLWRTRRATTKSIG